VSTLVLAGLNPEEIPMRQSTLIDFQQLCAQYPLKPWTVRSYCSQGKIPFVKIGRKVYFRVEDIEAWLDEHTKPALEVDAR
jgi:excisionase family DNA binding protein